MQFNIVVSNHKIVEGHLSYTSEERPKFIAIKSLLSQPKYLPKCGKFSGQDLANHLKMNDEFFDNSNIRKIIEWLFTCN